MQYNVIIADPPWPYERTHGQGVASQRYSLMTWDALAALGPLLGAVAAPNCALLLWTCPPLLMETIQMLRSWPFTYKTKAFTWVKTNRAGIVFHGIGSYTASNSEDVWLLSNGTPKRRRADISQIVATVETSTIVAAMGPHSRKPEIIQDRVERLFDGPYLELFARRQRPGWRCIGDEIDGLDIREALARVATDQPLPIVTPVASQPSLFALT